MSNTQLKLRLTNEKLMNLNRPKETDPKPTASTARSSPSLAHSSGSSDHANVRLLLSARSSTVISKLVTSHDSFARSRQDSFLECLDQESFLHPLTIIHHAN